MSNEEKIKEIVSKIKTLQKVIIKTDCLDIEDVRYYHDQDEVSIAWHALSIDLDDALKEYGQWVRQQILEEAIASLPKEKKGPPFDVLNSYADNEYNEGIYNGFNSCRQQTISNLQALKDKNK